MDDHDLQIHTGQRNGFILSHRLWWTAEEVRERLKLHQGGVGYILSNTFMLSYACSPDLPLESPSLDF